MLLRSFSSSKGWRLLSFLTMRGMTSSAASNVVKRSLQARHCRRRRICRPSPARRESMTFVSSWPQNGQCMKCHDRELGVDWKPGAELQDLPTDALDRLLVIKVVQYIRYPARQLARFLFPEAARRDGRRT